MSRNLKENIAGGHVINLCRCLYV